MRRRTLVILFGIAMLFVAAVVPVVLAGRAARANAVVAGADQRPVAGVDPLLVREQSTTDQAGRAVSGYAVSASGPNTLRPPGVSQLPGPGAAVVSPALAALLTSHDGDSLRHLFPMGIVGTIDDAGLADSGDLRYYVGDTSGGGGRPVYAFGVTTPSPAPWQLLPFTVLALAFGVVGLIRTLEPRLPRWTLSGSLVRFD